MCANEILRRYSEGHIGRHQAMEALEAEDFAALEAQLVAHGLPLYEPAVAETERKVARLRQWLERREGA